MKDKLLPCPFCGGEAEWSYLVPDGAIIGCKYAYSANPKCRIKPEIRRYRGDKEKSLEIAISDWNSRPSPWHTGIPTEDGDYLVQYKNSGHDVLHFADLRWFAFNRGGVEWQKIPDSSVIAWQKIEPYKEKDNG